ncbi:hypothetical protein [Nonomuraea sp. NPDC001831]|uniref:hypothetical protein n=1 Tax=Nonomuraea sp. NPDC001831 TaxID=3364340 RepID=UPI0036AE496C
MVSAAREVEEGGVLGVLDFQPCPDEHGRDQCLAREMPLLAPMSNRGCAQVQRPGQVDVQWLPVGVTAGLPAFSLLGAPGCLLHVPEEAAEELGDRIIFRPRCPIGSDHALFDLLVLDG